jgi:hypothetical protein
VPHLAEDYVAACRGEVPSNFKYMNKNWAVKIGYLIRHRKVSTLRSKLVILVLAFLPLLDIGCLL